MFKSALLSGALALMASTAQAAGPGSTVTFQGEGFVYATPTPPTAACANGNTAIGDYYRVIYRFKNVSTDPPDAVSLVGSRGVYRFNSTNSNGSLNGAATTVGVLIDGRADYYYDIAGTSNLTIGSNGGLATADAINIKLVGTIDNFFDTTGCTVTFHAVLTRRPN